MWVECFRLLLCRWLGLARSLGLSQVHSTTATFQWQPEIAVADTTIRMFLIACRDCVSLSPVPGAARCSSGESEKLSGNQSLLCIMLCLHYSMEPRAESRVLKLKSCKLSSSTIKIESFQLNLNTMRWRLIGSQEDFPFLSSLSLGIKFSSGLVYFVT